MLKPFDGRRILITGGTGSLGQTLARRILSGAHGEPERVVVFSRDEAKQHEMRMDYMHLRVATDEIIYENFKRTLEFVIGDVRDLEALRSVCRGIDLVFNAAALKQVPSCEYFPFEAVQTNIVGAENLVRVLRSDRCSVKRVVGVSTDKACKPVNVMGMTKALQERIFIAANIDRQETDFVCARYGNVLASRGSVVPLFHDQIARGGPVTITDAQMTRFLLSLEDAVDTIVAACAEAHPGEIFVPRAAAARMTDVAEVLIGDRPVETRIVGIRPGEKLHESLISDEEAQRTVQRGDYYSIMPMLSEIADERGAAPALDGEFSSDRFVVAKDQVHELMARNGLLVEQVSDRRANELHA